MALKDVLRNLSKIEKKMQMQSEKAIFDVSADLLRKSNELTPKDSGDLRKSGKVRMEKDTKGPVGKVSYGDANVDYAQKLHEIRYTNYTEPGTSWKYLERPLKSNSKQYKKYIESKLRKVIK